MENIVLGQRYPLLSPRQSLELEKKEKIPELATLQYVFKPSSIDNTRAGSLSISESNEAVIALPLKDGGAAMESFKGIATKPSNEFILVFNGASFQLEKVTTAVINIRHSRNESTYSTKDVSIGDARKFHEQALLLRAGPRPAKRKRATGQVNTKLVIKESSSLPENIPATTSAISLPNTTTYDDQQL